MCFFVKLSIKRIEITFVDEYRNNLAKLGDGLDKIPTDMVGDHSKTQLGFHRDRQNLSSFIKLNYVKEEDLKLSDLDGWKIETCLRLCLSRDYKWLCTSDVLLFQNVQ